MSTTILDRLMHHCHLLELVGRRYRLKEAAETLARETKNKLIKTLSPAVHGGRICATMSGGASTDRPGFDARRAETWRACSACSQGRAFWQCDLSSLKQ